MVILKYSPGKLYLATFFSGLGALIFLYLFLHPHEVENVRRARIFATGLGHGILAPGFFLACLGATINFALLASGDLSAIKTEGDGIRVRNFWKVHHISWSELLRIGIERKEYRRTVSYYLRFDVSDGGVGHSIKLNTQHMDIEPHALPGIIDDIEARRGRGPAAASARATAGFDADAALARYMARKASDDASPSDAVHAAPAPVRGGFGRKGL